MKSRARLAQNGLSATLIVLLLSVTAMTPLESLASCRIDADTLGKDFAVITGSGTGGTGFGGDDGSGSGTGGTGFSGEGGSGVGGTGFVSAVLGTITSFGSICVNGLKIEYDDSVPIEMNGRPIGAKGLAVGQVVRVETIPGLPVRARRVIVESAISGPVDRIDAEKSVLWIMGQPVQISPGQGFFDAGSREKRKLEALEPGTHIEVSGLRRSDGYIVASRLESRASNRPGLITGIAKSVSGNVVYVGSVRVELQAAEDSMAFGVGGRVQFRGRWNAKSKSFMATAMSDAPAVAVSSHDISIQGYLTSSKDGKDFRIVGTNVRVARSDKLPRGIKVDSRVRLVGRLDRTGRLHPNHVVIEFEGSRGAIEPGEIRGKLERGDKEERGDRSGREERAGRAERGDRSGRGDRSEREERPERSER